MEPQVLSSSSRSSVMASRVSTTRSSASASAGPLLSPPSALAEEASDAVRLRTLEDSALTRSNPPRCASRSEEHTSELQSRQYIVCRLLLEKKKSARWH